MAVGILETVAGEDGALETIHFCLLHEVIEAWRTANGGGIMAIAEVAHRAGIRATFIGPYRWNEVGKMPDSWLSEVKVL
jgi:hypothetical protein